MSEPRPRDTPRESASAEASGRLTAAVLCGLGLFLVVLALLGGDSTTNRGAVIITGVMVMLVAGVASVLPWDRWGSSASLALVTAVLAVLLIGDLMSNLSTDSEAAAAYPTLIVVLLGMLGFTHRRWVPLGYAPVAAAAMLFLITSTPESEVPVSALIVAVPGGVLLGESVAWALERYRQLRNRDAARGEDLERLTEALRRLRGRIDLSQAAHLVADVACDVFRSSNATIVLRGVDDNYEPVSVGRPAPAPPDLPAQLARVIEQGRPDIIAAADKATALLVMPLLGRAGRVVGAVVLERPHDDEDEYMSHLAGLFASQAGAALEQLMTIRELTLASTRDALTGMGNRRHAEALLESLQPGDAVILVDLDDFKTINDTYGHAGGDELLQEFSGFLGGFLRGSDQSARWGGEEFLVLARNAIADPIAAGERMLSRWHGTEPRTTFSAGVAVHETGMSPDTTVERADDALYQAKRAGKDRVVLYQPAAASA
ncbi:MAG: diguanylate cyclase [Actinomycetia bacterium]|nr:diguanylate cyclase [Actinomycetes bacterium]MCP3912093.1 diguanylate cyclase [Actinomycetes bacterium]MCP4086396.1 diguanylate cyclase [Actinomycetes bacterium]